MAFTYRSILFIHVSVKKNNEIGFLFHYQICMPFWFAKINVVEIVKDISVLCNGPETQFSIKPI